MSSSWKIGAVSGLIAGIVWGIAGVFIALVTLSLGLPSWGFELPPATPLIEIVLQFIIFNSIFGIFLGIIYSKIYDLIPGKTHVLKGLLFGLGIYFILWIRNTIFVYSYGLYDTTIACLIEVTPIIYGLILGIIYKEPISKLETKHNMKDGIIPGVITGAIFSFVLVISMVIHAYLGFVFEFMETIPDYVTDIGFIINQYGAHTVINMFMMGSYGAIYVMFYDKIPRNAIIKGAIFGFTIWVLTDLYNSVFNLANNDLPGALFAGLIIPDMYIAVGILIEGFYMKRWKAFPIAAALFIFSILKGFILSPLLGTN